MIIYKMGKQWLNAFGVLLLAMLPLVGREDLDRGIYATFMVKASQTSTLSLASSGIVESVMVEVGDKVKKDDILLKLKTKELYQICKLLRLL